jgi:hypothetical protein
MRNVSILIIKVLEEMFARKYGWPTSSQNTRVVTVISKTYALFKMGFKRASRQYVKTDETCFVFVDVKY